MYSPSLSLLASVEKNTILALFFFLSHTWINLKLLEFGLEWFLGLSSFHSSHPRVAEGKNVFIARLASDRRVFPVCAF